MKYKNLTGQMQVIETLNGGVSVRPYAESPDIEDGIIYDFEKERISKFFKPVLKSEAPKKSKRSKLEEPVEAESFFANEEAQ